jgi:imidazolonepropionase-like amidohydrolase
MEVRASIVAAILVTAAALTALAQPTSRSPLAPPPNGPRSTELDVHVVRNATVHVDPDTTISPGLVEFARGRIVRVSADSGAGYAPPPGAIVHDGAGMHVYAGFIDAFVEVDVPEPDANRSGAHWNPWVTPDRRASVVGSVPEGDAESRRALGFAAAGIAPDEGVFAGQGAVVSLAKQPADASAAFDRIYADSVFQTVRFETGSFSNMRYPTSHPGAVALMRQTLSDAEHQAQEGGNGVANALTPLESRSGPPLVFDCDRELEMVLAADVASEFERRFVLVDNGLSFKWLDAIAAADAPVVVSLRYPRKPDVSTPARAEEVDLDGLMAWEHAPANPARLRGAGVEVAITASKLPKGAKFHDHLREAIEAGLTESDALAALTTVPAEILGVSDQIGRIAPGMRANLVVTKGPIFEKKSKVLGVWIDGRHHRIADGDGASLNGTWAVVARAGERALFEAAIRVMGTGGEGKPKAKLVREGEDDAEVRMLAVDDRVVSFVLDGVGGMEGATILSGTLQPDGTMVGTGVAPDDSPFGWTAALAPEADAPDAAPEGDEAAVKVADEKGAEKDEGDKEGDAKQAEIPALPGYPFGAYAVAELPAQESVVITNATVWTLDARGVIPSGWVVVADGKIRSVGEGDPPATPSGGRVIDAGGGHVTPGLIDAHSHTSMFGLGVNEAGQTVTAEVRIGDAFDPSAVNLYRQLAAGVTTVLSLHGSANPIGGQSQTHKLRWGARSPKEMRFEGSKPGIKFALGENVTRANSRTSSDRYPASRMGVDALIRDRFTAAREYAAARASANPPRRDLELDALAEVLAGERLVHCHSYRQDEILMLCRVAEDYGFTIGTFQHGLEVYKVAEAVREVALGASIFSDWWMYKVEVIDAIPFAGPLQTEVGVVTSFNSDSDELARRLNLEAAKARRYARTDADGEPVISEVEALKFVTLNPAIQIGVADRVGSIEAGKDADLVIWSAHPLSTRAVATHTFIDGREHFSLEQDRAHRARIASERQRIIQKILGTPDKPRDKAKPGPDSPEDEILASYYREMIAQGRHPEHAEPGDCGCGVINHRLHVFMEKYGLSDHAGQSHSHSHDHDSHNH